MGGPEEKLTHSVYSEKYFWKITKLLKTLYTKTAAIVTFPFIILRKFGNFFLHLLFLLLFPPYMTCCAVALRVKHNWSFEMIKQTITFVEELGMKETSCQHLCLSISIYILKSKELIK